jgi:hypothetical protein
MNTESHILGILKEIRKQIKKGAGDTVHIALKQDTQERILAIPEDLMVKFNEYQQAKLYSTNCLILIEKSLLMLSKQLKSLKLETNESIV